MRTLVLGRGLRDWPSERDGEDGSLLRFGWCDRCGFLRARSCAFNCAGGLGPISYSVLQPMGLREMRARDKREGRQVLYLLAIFTNSSPDDAQIILLLLLKIIIYLSCYRCFTTL